MNEVAGVLAPPLAAGITVTPDGTGINRLPTAAQTAPFVLTNIGDAAGTFVVQTACSGAGVSGTDCFPDTTQVTLSAGQIDTVYARFTTLARGATGKVVLRAILLADTLVRDTGNVTVFVLSTPDVTPDTSKLRPPGTAVVDSFRVKNTTPNAHTFTLTPTCTWGSVTLACTGSPSSISIGAGATITATVSYVTGAAAQAGFIKLKAAQAGFEQSFDSGYVYVATRTPPKFAPAGGTISRITPYAPTSLPFTIRNPGAAAMSFDVAASCTGAAVPAGSCTVSPSNVTLAAGEVAPLSVAFVSGGANASGQIKLVGTLTGTTTKDSASVNLQTRSVGVVVAPRTLSRLQGASQVGVLDSVRVTNGGSDAEDFRVSISCTGTAIPAGCTSSRIVSLAGGASISVPFTYSTGFGATRVPSRRACVPSATRPSRTRPRFSSRFRCRPSRAASS